MNRYAQQLSLPSIGVSGQEKLNKSSVFIFGLGGLGTPILQILIGAGIRKIGVMDGDVVTLSNLHRQFIYKENQLNEKKVEVAKEFARELNSEVKICTFPNFLKHENRQEVATELKDYDLIIDATDNIQSSFMISKLCNELGKSCVYGGVYQNKGQISVFNYNGSPSYKDIFQNSQSLMPDCINSGVMGSVTSIIGSIMANEALKIILKLENVLSGKLLQLDLNTYQISIFEFNSLSKL
ncbi:MAG: HesA/MoeB/ThiF family protein [Flavobacteriales bacterium]|nr:HesA/MoeB/ThiF family protein [Flavobacteriales bacterium]